MATSKKLSKLPEVTQVDMWIMLLALIRYALGRRSYIVAVAQDIVLRYYKYLEIWQVKQIIEEIEKELYVAEKKNVFVGDLINHKIWKELCQELKNKIEM